ncbi:hypothetical protein [Ferruginibacter profundus]
MKKVLFLIALLISFTQLLKAQDKIYRKNGKIVEAKVLEIGAAEVKYKEFSNPDGPIYVLETDRIKKIIFENGKILTFEDNFRDVESYEGQAKKAIKINFFSPLYGYTEFGYEKNLGVGKSFELSLGFIGLGKTEQLSYYNSQLQNVKRNQAGAFVSGGYKFGKLPDFILFGRSRMSHLMQGTYVKPIIYFGHYSENMVTEKANNLYEVGKQQVTFGALQIEVGRQWVLGNKLVLDIYEGLGYGFDNKKDAYQYLNTSTYSNYNDEAAYNYVNARAGRSPSISFTFGVKLGLLIK